MEDSMRPPGMRDMLPDVGIDQLIYLGRFDEFADIVSPFIITDVANPFGPMNCALIKRDFVVFESRPRLGRQRWRQAQEREQGCDTDRGFHNSFSVG